jgi:hypothetical protein
MCGLGGILGDDVTLAEVKLMGILNEARGKQSTGLYSPRCDYLKHDSRATSFFTRDEVNEWIEKHRDAGGIMVHTRAATRGHVSVENAHPFIYGQVVGAHNGTIFDSPHKYSVDSMWAIDLLSQEKPGAYQKALGDLAGYYVLVWYDARDCNVYILNWNGDISISLKDGKVYYSSLGIDAKYVSGVEPTYRLQTGDVFRYSTLTKKLRKMKDFKGVAPNAPRPSSRNSLFTQTNTTYSGFQSGFNLTGRVIMLESKYSGTAARGVWWAYDRKDQVHYVNKQIDLHDIFPEAKIGEQLWIPMDKRESILGSAYKPFDLIIKDEQTLSQYVKKMDDDDTVVLSGRTKKIGERMIAENKENPNVLWVWELLAEDKEVDEFLCLHFDDQTTIDRVYIALGMYLVVDWDKSKEQLDKLKDFGLSDTDLAYVKYIAAEKRADFFGAWEEVTAERESELDRQFKEAMGGLTMD